MKTHAFDLLLRARCNRARTLKPAEMATEPTCKTCRGILRRTIAAHGRFRSWQALCHAIPKGSA